MFLAEGFCVSTQDVWIFVGKIVTIIKIIIPAILVVLGIISFGKAVIADDDKEIKSAVTKLIKKVVLGVFIFFIPTILSAIFGLVLPKDANSNNDFACCIDYVAGKPTC